MGCVVVAAAVVAFGLPLMAAPAHANPTIVVTTTADVIADDLEMSLREAVTKANADAGADVIQLIAGATHELTICGAPEDVTNTDDNSRRNLNAIDPAGLRLDGDSSIVQQACTDASLIHTGSRLVATAPLDVEGVAFVGGSSYGSVVARGRVSLTDSAVTDFERPAALGTSVMGAVFATGAVDAVGVTVARNRNVSGLSAGDDLYVADSVIEDNGGPVKLQAGGVWSDGDIDVVRSRIAGNVAADVSKHPTDWGRAGGISGSGSISVVDSEIVDNTGFSGGVGVSGGSPVSITNSSIVGNHGAVGGGVRGLLDVKRSTISGNDAGYGAGVFGRGTMVDTTIADNTSIGIPSTGAVGGSGGGLFADGAFDVRRSTITGNSALTGSGLGADFGGADAVVTVADSTISGNPLVALPPDPAALPPAEIWHGQNPTNGALRFQRTVIGTAGVLTCTPGGIPIVSDGGNFVADSSCGSGSATDLVNAGDPGLGPLEDNGGPTFTRLPLPGSPVRDRIPLSDPACAGVDQRGVARPQGLGCDIGAVEAEVLPAGFVGIAPRRVLDTREASGQKISGPGSIDVKVAGASGVPAEATAVVVNVTSTEASSADAFVTVWPAGLQRPGTSTLNLQPGGNVANSATIAPGVNGKVSLFTNTGATHLIVDVLGYYVPSGDRFTGVNPTRVLDTRTGPVPGSRPLGRKLSGPGSIRLPLAGAHGIPADVTGVVVNVTTTEATSANGFVTVWPSGGERPEASNLNLQPAFNVSNLAFVKLGAGGAIDLYTNAGATHLIIDVVGWFRPSTGDRFLPVNPARVFDSRDGAPFVRGATQFATVAGVSGLPADASSVVANATSTHASSAGGFLTVHAKGSSLPNPLTSNLNYRPPFNAPNQVVSRIGDDDSVALYNGWGTTHIIIDATGYFVP